MNTVTKIKEEFQSDHAEQLAAIRSDIDHLRSDLVALGDDLLDNEAAKQRRKKRPGSELWAHKFKVGNAGGMTEEMRQHWLAGAAVAGALVLAGGAFAIWSSRHTDTPEVLE
jgi:hypothetical protein